MRMRFKCFVVRRKTFLVHPYGANSKYFTNAHASGTRQKRIMSVASTCLAEMVNSVVVSRRANTLFLPAGLLENTGPLCTHRTCICKHLVCHEGVAKVTESMEFRAVADRVLWSKSQRFESNVKNATIPSNGE